jgi:hypothetical protein
MRVGYLRLEGWYQWSRLLPVPSSVNRGAETNALVAGREHSYNGLYCQHDVTQP